MQVKKDAKEWYYATAFLLGPDICRYGKLIKDLEHQFIYSSQNYPKTLVDAYNLINN